jgi:hypothetical protein
MLALCLKMKLAHCYSPYDSILHTGQFVSTYPPEDGAKVAVLSSLAVQVKEWRAGRGKRGRYLSRCNEVYARGMLVNTMIVRQFEER